MRSDHQLVPCSLLLISHCMHVYVSQPSEKDGGMVVFHEEVCLSLYELYIQSTLQESYPNLF